MERNDDTGLPAETGQTADTGQVNDMGPPDDTGQSDDMALSAYDPSVEWSNSAGLPDDGEPYYGSDPPDDTGQANSTGQASSTGETENEILEDAVIDVMIVVMLPCFLMAMYEKHGQPLETVVKNIIQTKFVRPKERPYQTQNLYAVLERQRKLEKEVSAIVKGTNQRRRTGKKPRN